MTLCLAWTVFEISAAVLALASAAVLVGVLLHQFGKKDDDDAKTNARFNILTGGIVAAAVLFALAATSAVLAKRDGPESSGQWKRGYDEFVLTEPMVAFRVYGDEGQRWGRWLTFHRPKAAVEARRRLSLNPRIGARCVATVSLSEKVRVRVGLAGSRNGSPGGWSQIEIVGPLPVSQLVRSGRLRFGPGEPVATGRKACKSG
jgi:hypothetical protein